MLSHFMTPSHFMTHFMTHSQFMTSLQTECQLKFVLGDRLTNIWEYSNIIDCWTKKSGKVVQQRSSICFTENPVRSTCCEAAATTFPLKKTVGESLEERNKSLCRM